MNKVLGITLLAAVVGVGCFFLLKSGSTPSLTPVEVGGANVPIERRDPPAPASGELARSAVAEPPVDDAGLDPWDPKVIAKKPVDAWGQPSETEPYLHEMLNRTSFVDAAEKGELAAYGINFNLIFDNLPEGIREQAKARSAEIAQLVAEHARAAKLLEVEHWRQRLLDYHRAIENHDYVVVRHVDGQSEEQTARNNIAALDALKLGKMNLDFFYICSSTPSALGRASGLIYITRQKYPDSFESLQELSRISSDAQSVIRRHLGVTEPPPGPIFPIPER
jgi:hypothetical protein